MNLEPVEIQSFIWYCLYGNGRMVVRDTTSDSKAVLDSGKYIVKVRGRYAVQPFKEQSHLQDIFVRLIEKFERFEYDGYLYYKVENGWAKEII